MTSLADAWLGLTDSCQSGNGSSTDLSNPFPAWVR